MDTYSFSSLFFSLFFFFFIIILSSASPKSLRTLSYEEGFTQLFGESNLMLHNGGKTVSISLDQKTGSGFKSKDLFLHGYFSAKIKLHPGYTAGIVVAFYLTNDAVFKKTHDELDFEFLGNIRGKQWRVQTNVYANGSTSMGREERYDCWFDPTEDFHKYSILWTENHIVFYIDDIPIREVLRESMENYPSKPMYLYVTIWDGSDWATSGGAYKVDYGLAPFVAQFTDLVLQGCPVSPIENLGPHCSDRQVDDFLHNTATLSTKEQAAMARIRRDYMTHYYCNNHDRYLIPPPECSRDRVQMTKRYMPDGDIKFSKQHLRHRSHRNRHRQNAVLFTDAAS